MLKKQQQQQTKNNEKINKQNVKIKEITNKNATALSRLCDSLLALGIQFAPNVHYNSKYNLHLTYISDLFVKHGRYHQMI